jgi:transcriptional regulator with XRE-family HTH domain
MEINEIVRRLRESKSLTQENVADEIGVHVSTFLRYETNGKKIPSNKLELIAKMLGTTVADIYAYKQNPGLLEAPLEFAKRKKEVSIIVHLDGSTHTLNEWIKTLKSLNSSIQ